MEINKFDRSITHTGAFAPTCGQELKADGSIYDQLDCGGPLDASDFIPCGSTYLLTSLNTGPIPAGSAAHRHWSNYSKG